MAESPLEIYFLDVGSVKYGDCILIRQGQRTILIDGGHQGDFRDRPGYPSIPSQLGGILGESTPHELSMLVVTHAHSDHIGCLPEMVAQGIITAKTAYVADIDLGWGRGLDAVTDVRAQRLLAVVREGVGATLQADDPQAAIADALSLKARYQQMLDKLAADGTTVVSCTGDEDRAELERDFRSMGLKILGPTRRHLQLCAQGLTQRVGDAVLFARDAMDADAGLSELALLKAVLERQQDSNPDFLLDMVGEGACLNDQSIVLALEFAGKRVLLAGDQQLAEPQVNGLEEEMSDLRRTIKSVGPFQIAKTTHHSSYNGVNESVLEEQVPTDEAFYLVHSGGLNDPSHPEPNVLNILQKLKRRRSDFTWLRTDRNGQISFAIGLDGAISATYAKGRINNFLANTRDEVMQPAAPVNPAPLLKPTPPSDGGEIVEVIARVPHTKTKITVTIEVEPGPKPIAQSASPEPLPLPPRPRDPGVNDAPNFQMPSDRVLPKLLFVTDEAALGRKIGDANVKALLSAIRTSNQVVVSEALAGLSGSAAAALVRPHLGDFKGVVLLGGLDVVPSVRLDVLDPALRQRVLSPNDDPDHFIVWSDDVYGDQDGDQIAELPVSRVADGGSARLMAAALAARGHGLAGRFGIRNLARPFAERIFSTLPGAQPLHTSDPLVSSQVASGDLRADFVYLMLHGSDSNGREFWGESGQAELRSAFTTGEVGATFNGVVFTGCCWGALTTKRPALFTQASSSLNCRVAAESIALSFLAAGAQAFVGCTGVHYSPPGKDPGSAGGPMHSGFFRQLLAGSAPAPALFEAKRAYLQALDGNTSPEELAVALKIIRQYTCLGLGW